MRTINRLGVSSAPSWLNKCSGAELNYGYTRNTPTYSSDSGSPEVENNSNEPLAAYVFRCPQKRWPAVVQAGALIFDPTNVAGAATQSRLAYLYGADLNTKHHVPQTGHRGGFYNSATFNMDGPNGRDQFTNRAESSVVYGYSFKR